MKPLATICAVLVLGTFAMAQIKAVTSSGEEVILSNDGTWKYVKADAGSATAIATNPALFSQGKDATFPVKSAVVNASVYLNPKKWSFKKGEADAAAEFTFELKKKDAYAMVITERIEMTIEALRNVALENAKNAAPDARIVSEEYRTVNGTKILCMQMEGTASGIKFTYYGYYYAGSAGVLQLLTYTSQNLFEEYRPELQEFLNGLVIGGK